MKISTNKHRSSFVAAVCCLSLGHSAYGQTWSLEKVDLQGSSSTVEYGQSFNDLYGDLGQLAAEWDQHPIWHQNGFVGVKLQSQIEPNSNATAGGKIIQLTNANGDLKARIKGPVGCAGQKQKVTFLIQAFVASSVYSHVSEPEPDGETPEPIVNPFGGAAHMNMNIGSTAVNTNISQEGEGSVTGAAPQKKGLFTVEVTYDVNEKAEVLIPFSMTGEASHHYPVQEIPSIFNINAQSEGGFYIAPDTRYVTLTRANAPTALRTKIYNPVTHAIIDNPELLRTRDEWIEFDGHGHGHTLASYLERILIGGPIVATAPDDDLRDVSQTILANRGGGWSNQLTWKWSPSLGDAAPPNDPYWPWTREATIGVISSETEHNQIRVMPYSNAINNPNGVGINQLGFYSENVVPAGWINHRSNKAGNVVNYQYELTDNNDGASAVGKYTLMLHDEWENAITDTRYHPIGDASESGKGLTKEEYFIVPSNATSVKLNDHWEWELSSTENLEFKLEASFEGGFKIADWGNANGSVSASKTYTYQQVIKTSPSPLLGQDANPKYGSDMRDADIRFVTVIVYQATREHKLLNHFGQSGFIESEAGKIENPMALSPIPRTYLERKDERWGRTPQSKVIDIEFPRADWWPYRVGQNIPGVGDSGTWNFYGSTSAGGS